MSLGRRDSARAWALRRVVLPIADRLAGQPMIRRLDFLERAQWWDRDRLVRYRDDALARLVATCAREVPFYRRLFADAGIDPASVRSAADLVRLPVVTKAMLRADYPDGTVRPTGRATYEVRSSGSTGASFRVVEDAETAGTYRACFLLALEWAGWRLGERHVQTGMYAARSGLRYAKDRLLRCEYVLASELDDDSLDRTLDTLEAGSIGHLWGYPGTLYYLSRRARARGWNRDLRSVVTWGDNLHEHYRQSIESAFGVRVTDTYGCGEGVQISAQCGASSSYHLHSADVVVECVDAEGRAVEPGTPGRILVTRLHPGPMPLIRYRIGDVGILAPPDAACPCGRSFELLERVEGREGDVVVTPSGNRLVVEVFANVLKSFDAVETFQVTQHELGAITMLVTARERLDDDVPSAIVRALELRGSGELDVRLKVVDEIPPSPTGKRRFVISTLAERS